MATDEALTESWFIRPVARRSPELDEVLEPTPRRKPSGRLGWALGLGAAGGAVGAVLMLLAAGAIARQVGVGGDLDAVSVVGDLARAWTGAADSFASGLGAAAAVGAALGAGFGLLTRHSLRFSSRALTGALLAPTLWTLFDAFVFKTHASSSLGALPFGPMVAASAIFGVAATLIAPPRIRHPARG